MRRISAIGLCSLLLQVVVPSQAHAWWDIIEQLSGPGRFYGWDMQVRLLCLVDTIKPPADPTQKPQVVATKFVIPPPIGIIISACQAESETKDEKGNITEQKKRRLSVDLGARFVWAKDNPEFADGGRISLTTLEPSVSVPLLGKFERADILDYGFGAGVYWFSSTEFPSFNGAFLEPIRLELHAPFKWRVHGWSAAIPRARFGLMVFPAGFERAAFDATSPLPLRISRDWVKNFALDFDLEPLMKYLQPR